MLPWRVVLSMVEHRAKKVVRKSYANYGHERVIVKIEHLALQVLRVTDYALRQRRQYPGVE